MQRADDQRYRGYFGIFTVDGVLCTHQGVTRLLAFPAQIGPR